MSQKGVVVVRRMCGRSFNRRKCECEGVDRTHEECGWPMAARFYGARVTTRVGEGALGRISGVKVGSLRRGLRRAHL